MRGELEKMRLLWRKSEKHRGKKYIPLAGTARAHHYGRQYPDTTEPAVVQAPAHLSSEFGAKYAEAKVWTCVYQYKNKPGSQGKDVTMAHSQRSVPLTSDSHYAAPHGPGEPAGGGYSFSVCEWLAL